MWAGLRLSWSSHSWSIPFYKYCPLVKIWIQSSSRVSNLKQENVNTLMRMKVQAAQYLMYKFLFEGTEACAWNLFLIYAFLAEFSQPSVFWDLILTIQAKIFRHAYCDRYRYLKNIMLLCLKNQILQMSCHKNYFNVCQIFINCFQYKKSDKKNTKIPIKRFFFSRKYIREKLTYFWRVSVHTHTVCVYSPDFFKYMRLEPSYHCKHRNCWKPELETGINWSAATYKIFVFLFSDKLRTFDITYEIWLSKYTALVRSAHKNMQVFKHSTTFIAKSPRYRSK